MGARALLLSLVSAGAVAAGCAAGSSGHASYNPAAGGAAGADAGGAADASADSGGSSGGAAASGGSAGSFSDASFEVSTSDSGFDPDAGCATSTQTAQVDKLPVDIIWVVDNSVSMQPAVDQVTQGLNNFAQLIAAKNLDYRVIMLSLRGSGQVTIGSSKRYAVCIPQPLGGANCADNPPLFYQSSIDIKSTQPLEQFLGTLGQTSGYQPGDSRGGDPWKQWLRPNATKTIVDVTDDDSRFDANQFEHFAGGKDPSNSTMLPPGILDASWNGLFDGYVFDALYGWGSATDPNVRCQYPDGTYPPKPGLTYTDLVQKTGGVRAQICDGAKAWGPFFDAVATAVQKASKISCELAIPTPEAGTLDPAKINVQLDSQGSQQLLYKVSGASACGTNGGWYYDNDTSPTKVILCPASCDQAQQQVQSTGNASLNVVFGCKTQTVIK